MDSLIATVIGATTIGISQVTGFNAITLPLFNVPVTVLTMAAGGALVSFAHGDPVRDRGALFKLAAANTFIGVILVAVIPPAFGWQWAKPEVVPPLAALVAWACRWVVPNFIKYVPEIVQRLFKLNKYKDIGDGDSDTYYQQEPWNTDRGLKDKYYEDDN